MQIGEQKWPEIQEIAPHRVAVLPIGSLEQHGHHLPLLTDTYIVSAIAEQSASQLEDIALFLPTLWVGTSEHHRRFPGTVSLKPTTYTTVLIDILESLIDTGFRRILLLNAHAGNVVSARQAIHEVRMRYRESWDLWIVLASWWMLARDRIAHLQDLASRWVSHACEQETSLILHLCPHLVDMEKAIGYWPTVGSQYFTPGNPFVSKVESAIPFEQMTITGALGHPEVATPEKGERLLKVIVKETVEFIREFAQWPPLPEKG